jgi:hypothetical protein
MGGVFACRPTILLTSGKYRSTGSDKETFPYADPPAVKGRVQIAAVPPPGSEPPVNATVTPSGYLVDVP